MKSFTSLPVWFRLSAGRCFHNKSSDDAMIRHQTETARDKLVNAGQHLAAKERFGGGDKKRAKREGVLNNTLE